MLSLSYFDRLQDGPRGAQEAPRPPQERPKRLQEAAKSAPGGSKRASRDSKSRSRGLKTLQDRPKRLQKTPRTLNIQKRHLEQLQRCPAKMPCHRMADGHAKRWRAGGGVPPKGKAINFLSCRRSLAGLKSSGRPIGTISTNFRQNPSGGFRAMTKKPSNFTTINTTTISM